MIDTNSNLVVVDVREETEYCDDADTPPGHIPGALNYPWATGVLEATYDELPIDGDILIHCRSGVRSAAAADFLCLQGFTNIYNMTGGMLAWQWETVGCCYSDADCDDAMFCTGQETCVNLNCQQGEVQCINTYERCDEDNDTCVACPDDCDCDGIMDGEDCCFVSAVGADTPNGPDLGTCVRETNGVMLGSGVECDDSGDCGAGEICQKDQGDYNANGVGDVCECYANIDGDDAIGLFDLAIVKSEFGNTGCTPLTCYADIDGDGEVGLFDLSIVKGQFGAENCLPVP
jgi:rhodanese-related sulfurtransferase